MSRFLLFNLLLLAIFNLLEPHDDFAWRVFTNNLTPGFHVAKSTKTEFLKKNPTLCVKMAFSSQHYINFPHK
jgi:hypothetical protein